MQDGNKRHCDERYLALNKIGSEVIYDRYTDIDKEDDRNKKRIRHKEQDYKCESDCDHRIDRSLLGDKILSIRYDCGHARQQTLCTGNLSDLPYRLHRLVSGARRIKEDKHQASVAVLRHKHILYFGRHHLDRDLPVS